MAAASSSTSFKTNYAVFRRIEPFYKGGRIQVNQDGEYIFCACGSKVNVVDISTGDVVRSIEQVIKHLVAFHPDISQLQLFSSSMDNIIRIWDLNSSQCIAQLENHYSPVTSLAFSPDSETLISAGRDKICTVWDLNKKEPKGTIPVYEVKLISIPSWILRVWDAASATCVHSQSLPHLPDQSKEEEAGEHSLVHCTLVPVKSEIVAVNAEHNISMYNFSGYNGEVLDVRFLGPKDSHIVVATNSPQLKVFELSSSHCQVLYGHTDTVLGLDVFRKGRMFASCAKPVPKMKENFVVTASQDHTIKVWHLPESLSAKKKESDLEILQPQVTVKAHDKDINSVAVSPNDKLIATGSQDKTAKLWSCKDCGLLGVFSGHKRGIWCVQFSPVDQVLATSSADGTIKLWDLQDFSCLKTFEGHDASVLKVIFVSRGGQVLSSGSDGLLKLWTIKSNECVKTLDGHDDKVWGLHANKKDNLVVTGSSDSRVLLWKDVTQIELEEKQAKEEEEILKEQELSNLLHEKKFLKALGLAISLDRPHTVLNVIKAILKENNGREDLAKNIAKLRKDQKEAVLKFSVIWNTNSRNCHEAQAVLETLLKHEMPECLLQYEGIKGAVESLLPYTGKWPSPHSAEPWVPKPFGSCHLRREKERCCDPCQLMDFPVRLFNFQTWFLSAERHFQRLSRLLQASMFLDFMWQNMRLPDASEQDEEMET
ncbi:hypothetical protein JD844_019528 [Phrynosoma platyrhinos]|uniref:U3 small nucleolar RNA-associated protein 13 C-terminal domain-containing protein n=1 Tax=Phrynosoma platyrhinos TaxID=52577 RepID=A0ABQ7TQX4_PHRPL|nr:hypothetical protein JD844_019528 [Phrynosoma platyrhinos]